MPIDCKVNKEFRILLIEDNRGDAILIDYMLRDAPRGRYHLHNVSTFQDGAMLLGTEHWDLLLLDLSLPDTYGLATLENANNIAPELPIIVLTGRDDDELALEVMKSGAQDYLVKGQIGTGTLTKAIRYAIERKALEVSLRASNQQLTKTNKALDNFVYLVSHDLKKPVANIQGLLLMLKGEAANLSDRGKKVIDKLETSGVQLKTMIEELLADIRNRDLTQQTEVSLKKVLDDVTRSIDELILSHGATIESDFTALPSIRYSYQDLRSILYNLITNSIKYGAATRPAVIKIKSELAIRGGCLWIEDNGMGIDLEQFGDKLFSKYNRVHKHAEGSGLGLWLVKETVEKNGGKITVDSTPGQGTRFTVIL